MSTGAIHSTIVDSLSAFFPGVQTLVGDLESAIKSHAVYAYQWKVSRRFCLVYRICS
jgi:mannosidase alpha-like ER degradation enhancer 1